MTHDDFDLSSIDVTTLTAGEYQAVKRRAMNRAQVERSRAAGGAFTWLVERARGRKPSLSPTDS